MQKNVTSRDVAETAGVSRAAVSYVLNNIKEVKIKPETRKKVLAAARELNYQPHSIARALKTEKSMSIGVVSRRVIAEDRFSLVLRGIKDAVKEHKYSITLCSDEKDINDNREFINYYLAKRIDGVIMLSAEETLSKDIIEKLTIRDFPSVLVDYHIKDKNIDCVDIDYFDGGFKAANYLIEQGYSRIIYFAPDINISQEKERLQGVRAAVNKSASRITDYREFISGKTGLEYMNSTSSMLKNRGRSTAVIISWVNAAYKTLSEASKLGISVPQNLAVISLAGSHYADLSYPRLSTCDLPLYELGYESGKILIARIQTDIEKLQVVHKNLPCILRTREST